MIGQHGKARALLGMIAAMLVFAGCETDSNPYGPPYLDLGRLLAGNYVPTSPGTNQGLRLSLGSRHTVAGRYDSASGELVRFYGTWDRVGDRLFLQLDAAPGVPSTIELAYARETILTLIPTNPLPRDEDAPDDSERFLQQDIMRLVGTAVVGGVSLNLDLARVITDVITVGSGGQRN